MGMASGAAAAWKPLAGWIRRTNLSIRSPIQAFGDYCCGPLLRNWTLFGTVSSLCRRKHASSDSPSDTEPCAWSCSASFARLTMAWCPGRSEFEVICLGTKKELLRKPSYSWQSVRASRETRSESVFGRWYKYPVHSSGEVHVLWDKANASLASSR